MIDLSPSHREIILNILKAYAPDCEVRVFGSRYTGAARKYSDLDLVLVGERKRTLKEMGDLREAFQESVLPFRVDVLDWLAISPEFQRVIEQGYEVIRQPQLPVRPARG
jgi:predicted nucleotidyltransferase